MKKYLLLFAVVAVLAGCSKDDALEKDPNINGAATKTYSMSVDLMAGQHINVGSVSFYDPTDGNGGPLEVTYTLTGGWTMTESHVYAGPYKNNEMPVNKPGAPKVGKFPYKETHSNVTTYTYYIPIGEVDMSDFAIAAHCVVNNNGNETGWADGDQTFSDKGWGTYITNFYAPTNFVPNPLYGIEETNDGTLNLVLINGNNGNGELIYSENITGSNGTISAACYDPLTSTLFFMIGNSLYANNLRTDDPTVLIMSLGSNVISGATFMGNSYYYFDNDPNSANYNMIVQVLMSHDGDAWSYVNNSELPFSGEMTYDITITDIASNANYFYLIGFNNVSGSVDLVTYDINAGSFDPIIITTDINSNIDSPTVAWGTNSNTLYGLNATDTGEEFLISINLDNGETDGDSNTDPNGDDDDGDIDIIVKGL